MDLLVHASLREGLARAIPQALLAGRPAVAYDLDGTPEVVIPGRTGLLIRPRDIPALADAIVTLALDPTRRRAMGEAGRALCRDRFPAEVMVRRLESLYLEHLGRRPRRIPGDNT
jgi:glycosyltransferase involved in cell wall biosynthesis